MAKSRSLNRVELIGNLTRNPVLRQSSSGVTVCTFGLATNTSWRDGDGQNQERVEFHNIVAFNKLAEICAQVLSIGMLVYIDGELRTRVKERDNGEKYHKVEIKLNDMILLNSKNKEPVGLDAAKQAGEDLSNKLGDSNQMPEPTPADVVEDTSSDDNDDDIDAKDLF
jgi:single-strand DNA-binding protein